MDHDSAKIQHFSNVLVKKLPTSVVEHTYVVHTGVDMDTEPLLYQNKSYSFVTFHTYKWSE